MEQQASDGVGSCSLPRGVAAADGEDGVTFPPRSLVRETKRQGCRGRLGHVDLPLWARRGGDRRELPPANFTAPQGFAFGASTNQTTAFVRAIFI